jgi:hypothetical protein
MATLEVEGVTTAPAALAEIWNSDIPCPIAVDVGGVNNERHGDVTYVAPSAEGLAGELKYVCSRLSGMFAEVA